MSNALAAGDEPDDIDALIGRILWHSGTPGCGPDAVILTCQYCIDLRGKS
jgi:hypothetical protein